jgi:hypothetical protein
MHRRIGCLAGILAAPMLLAPRRPRTSSTECALGSRRPSSAPTERTKYEGPQAMTSSPQELERTASGPEAEMT